MRHCCRIGCLRVICLYMKDVHMTVTGLSLAKLSKHVAPSVCSRTYDSLARSLSRYLCPMASLCRLNCTECAYPSSETSFCGSVMPHCPSVASMLASISESCEALSDMKESCKPSILSAHQETHLRHKRSLLPSHHCRSIPVAWTIPPSY